MEKAVGFGVIHFLAIAHAIARGAYDELDRDAEALWRDVSNLIMDHYLLIENKREMAAAVRQADDLWAIYKKYLDGGIPTKELLGQVVTGYLGSELLSVGPADLQLLAPERDVISRTTTKGNRGPEEYARFVIGRLRKRNKTTIRGWKKKPEALLVPAALRLRVPKQELVKFVEESAGSWNVTSDLRSAIARRSTSGLRELLQDPGAANPRTSWPGWIDLFAAKAESDRENQELRDDLLKRRKDV